MHPSGRRRWRCRGGSGPWSHRDVIDTIADGVAGRYPIPEVLEDLLEVVDDVVLVGEDSIKAGMRQLFELAGLVVEPSAALGLAAIVEDRERFRGLAVATSSAAATSPRRLPTLGTQVKERVRPSATDPIAASTAALASVWWIGYSKVDRRHVRHRGDATTPASRSTIHVERVSEPGHGRPFGRSARWRRLRRDDARPRQRPAMATRPPMPRQPPAIARTIGRRRPATHPVWDRNHEHGTEAHGRAGRQPSPAPPASGCDTEATTETAANTNHDARCGLVVPR